LYFHIIFRFYIYSSIVVILGKSWLDYCYRGSWK